MQHSIISGSHWSLSAYNLKFVRFYIFNDKSNQSNLQLEPPLHSTSYTHGFVSFYIFKGKFLIMKYPVILIADGIWILTKSSRENKNNINLNKFKKYPKNLNNNNMYFFSQIEKWMRIFKVEKKWKIWKRHSENIFQKM